MEMMRTGHPPVVAARATGIPVNLLRVLLHREKQWRKKLEQEIPGMAENDFLGITEIETPVTTAPETVDLTTSKVRVGIGLKDVVFYATMLTACIGFWSVLKWYSLPLVLIYVLISVDALAMAKNPAIPKSARLGQNAVWVMETIAVPFHIALFNRALWANVSALPFDIREAVRSGEWYWQNGEKPFYCACFIAALLFCAAIYSVNATLKVTTEINKIN